MNAKLMMSVSAAFAAGLLSAETVTCKVGIGPGPDSSGYYESPFDGVAQTSTGADFWSDGKVPHSDADYSQNEVPIITPKTDENGKTYLFDGNSMLVNNQVQNKTMYPSVLSFAHEGLRLANTGRWYNNREVRKGDFCQIDGKVSLDASSVWGDGFTFCPGQRTYTGCGIRLTGSFCASSGWCYVKMYDNNRLPGVLELTGNCDDFKGTIELQGNTLRLGNSGMPNATLRFYPQNGYSPAFETSAGAGVSVAVNTFTVGSGAGAVDVKIAGTNKLEIGTLYCEGANSSLSFKVDGAAASGMGGARVSTWMSVKQFPIAVSFTDSDFPNAAHVPFLSWKTSFASDWDASKFAVADNGRGAKVTLATDGDYTIAYLDCEAKPITLLASDGGFAQWDFPSAFTNASSWSDGKLPHSDGKYLVETINGAAANLLSPYRSPTPCTFDGASLTIGFGCGFGVRQSTEVHVDNLIMKSGSVIQFLEDNKSCLTGGMEICPGSHPVTFRIHLQGVATNAATITGSGDVVVNGYPTSGGPWGTMVLTGDNSGYAGTFKVWFGGSGEPTAEKCERLRFIGNTALGGPLEAVTPTAVTMTEYGMLWPIGSVTLSEPTRGLHVEGQGQIAVDANAVFGIRSPFSVNGTLHKRGAGVLALGSRPTFGSAGTDVMPTADCNVLRVEEGSLMALSTNCVEGLSLVFSEGAGLSVQADVADEDVKTFGFFLGDGVSATLANDRLPVSVILGNGEMPETGVSVAVLTVPDQKAGLWRNKLEVASPIRGYKGRIVESQPYPGVTTFTAEVFRPGLAIILR